MFDCFRISLITKAVHLSKLPECVVVQFERETSSINIRCHTTTAKERKTLLQYSYLTIAENLDTCNQKVTGENFIGVFSYVGFGRDCWFKTRYSPY